MLKRIRALIYEFAGLFYRRLDVHVDGVEITQAIQYYHSRRHLSDPAQQGLDNSVRLVIGKPALVRVYLRSGQRSFGAATATLEVRRRDTHGIYQKIAMLTPLPPEEMIAQSDPPYAEERGTGEYQQPLRPPLYWMITGSLNFAVPADMMAGSMLFHVTVSEGRNFGGIFPPPIRDTYDVYADVHLRQTLRLRSIMVGYAGPKSSSDPSPLFLDPPSFPADLLNTAKTTLLMYPVQNKADCSSAGFVTCDRPLDDAAGCSPNWDALIAKLIAQKSADGNRSDVIYYGLLPTDIPFRGGSFDIGCERSGMSVGRVPGHASTNLDIQGGSVMAHLVGHECGLLHGDVDPNRPAYPPYDPIGTPKGSIGEYGALPPNALYLPQNIRDFMDFGSWISLYNYGRLIENPRLDPVMTSDEITATQSQISVVSRYAPDVDPQPMISIIGLMQSERTFEATSVMRLETRTLPLSARATLRAELRDESGALVAQAPLRMLLSWRDGGACCEHGERTSRFPCVVQALLPDAERGALLAITDGERDLWSCAARGTKPYISSFGASVNENRLAVAWNVEAECTATEVWLQWSADRGETWNALATGLSGDAGEFDASHLPAGTVTLRLLVSDGFDTEISEPACIQVPLRPPVVSILSPNEGEILAPGGILRLWAAVTINGVTAMAVEKAQWLLDGELVAEGLDAFFLAPRAGEHILKLIVTADRLEGKASHRFVTVELPGVPCRNALPQ